MSHLAPVFQRRKKVCSCVEALYFLEVLLAMLFPLCILKMVLGMCSCASFFLFKLCHVFSRPIDNKMICKSMQCAKSEQKRLFCSNFPTLLQSCENEFHTLNVFVEIKE